jgi:prolyl 4-hydroxylase
MPAPVAGFDREGDADVSLELVALWPVEIWLAHGVVDDADAARIVALGKAQGLRPAAMREGSAASADARGPPRPELRSGEGAFVAARRDAAVWRLTRRLSRIARVPHGNLELPFLLRYTKGQRYARHLDLYPADGRAAWGGQRQATALVWLSDETRLEGGETFFPDVAPSDLEAGVWSGSEFGKIAKLGKFPNSGSRDGAGRPMLHFGGEARCGEGLKVRPRKGSALIFFSRGRDGRPAPGAAHGGCPVVRGEKLLASVWMHCFRFPRELVRAPRADDGDFPVCGGEVERSVPDGEYWHVLED